MVRILLREVPERNLVMQSPQLTDTDEQLLRILVSIHSWEDLHFSEIHTVAGRDLYFKVAERSLLATTGSSHSLKQLTGRITDRSTRSKLREFEVMGLIKTEINPEDERRRRVVATDYFIARLKQHVSAVRKIIEPHCLLLSNSHFSC